MKRLLVWALLPGCAALASATDVNVKVDGLKIQSGNMTITFGDRDKRGYYWDGKEWRDPVYWEKHHGKGKGQQCPPGQAKKGNC